MRTEKEIQDSLFILQAELDAERVILSGLRPIDVSLSRQKHDEIFDKVIALNWVLGKVETLSSE